MNSWDRFRNRHEVARLTEELSKANKLVEETRKALYAQDQEISKWRTMHYGLIRDTSRFESRLLILERSLNKELTKKYFGTTKKK